MPARLLPTIYPSTLTPIKLIAHSLSSLEIEISNHFLDLSLLAVEEEAFSRGQLGHFHTIYHNNKSALRM